jgi:hypothetical protein
MEFIDVALGQIDVGERQRVNYGDLNALAKGMKRVGLLEPIMRISEIKRTKKRSTASPRLSPRRVSRRTVLSTEHRHRLTE